MKQDKPQIQNKSVMFFSISSPKDIRIALEQDILNILISYHYIKKHRSQIETELIPEIRNRGGLFMTDSGAFSIRQAGKSKDISDLYDPDTYQAYNEEYVQWCYDFHKYIFCIANMDMDNYVGREKVVEWNDKYFRDLEKKTNVIYNVIKDDSGYYKDPKGLNRLKEYCSMYDYVGVNQTMRPYADKIYSILKHYQRRIHGFAWTSFPTLMQYPMFSVDSSTWSAGQRFGATFIDDGKNFYRKDYAKHTRKTKKFFCKDKGLNFDALMTDNIEAVTRYSFESWKGFVREYSKVANLKLWNKPVIYYDKRGIK